MRYGFFLSFENNLKVGNVPKSNLRYANFLALSYPRFLHALRVGRRFVETEKLPHRRVGSHGVIAQDGVDEGLQTLYPVVDEPAAEVIAEPFLPRQYQGVVRKE